MKNSTIEQLLYNKLNYKNLLLTYNFQQTPFHFFKNWFNNYFSDNDISELIYLSFETLINEGFLNSWNFSEEISKKIKFVNPFEFSKKPEDFKFDAEALVAHLKTQYKEDSIVILDNLPYFWENVPKGKQFGYFKQLSELFNGKIILLLPQNTLANEQPSIEYLCSTKIQLLNLDHLFSIDLEFQEYNDFDINLECNHAIHYVMQISHTSGGKQTSEKTIVKWDESKLEFDTINYNTLIDNLTKQTEKIEAPASAQGSIDALTSDLSFNLNLTDKQKSQKEALILPYVHTSEDGPSSQETPSAVGTGGQAQIVYYPDEGDDWDDEDPDDDLDI